MVVSKKLIFTSLGALLLVGVAAAAYFGLARPRAEVAATLHDFGSFSEDQRPTHTFLIKNVGSRPLEITNVHPQCACTAKAYDRLIPPGGQGAVTLSIRPFTLRGQFAKKTEVFLNDPDQPRLVFTLKGISRPLIEIQPNYIIRFRGKPGEDLHRQVRLISNLPESWEVSSFKTNIPQFIDVNLHPSEPGKSYVVEVRQKRREPGKYQGMIELFTTVPKRPHLVLRVFGEVLAP
jgi:Protein of unknown function (DUF1573)